MSDHAELLARLGEPFPDHAVKQRKGGGGQMLSYISGDTIIRRLNHVAGAWDFRITATDWRPFGTDMLIVVTGDLTIPGLGTRAGIGVQVVRERGGEDLVKGAQTDSLKKAAVSFGVGLELYGPDLEAGEVPAARPATPRAPSDSSTPTSARPQDDQGPSGEPRAATDPQRNFITRLLKNANMDRPSANQWCSDHGFTPETMSAGQASSFIDFLKPLAGFEETER